jgi:dTDP-4-amino-4,6-dideoxygalactose transaminase
MKYLKRNGVETMIHYKKRIKNLYIFKKYKALTPVADSLSKPSISLPIHPYLKKKELNYIVSKINYFFNQNYQII